MREVTIDSGELILKDKTCHSLIYFVLKHPWLIFIQILYDFKFSFQAFYTYWWQKIEIKSVSFLY